MLLKLSSFAYFQESLYSKSFEASKNLLNMFNRNLKNSQYLLQVDVKKLRTMYRRPIGMDDRMKKHKHIQDYYDETTNQAGSNFDNETDFSEHKHSFSFNKENLSERHIDESFGKKRNENQFSKDKAKLFDTNQSYKKNSPNDFNKKQSYKKVASKNLDNDHKILKHLNIKPYLSASKKVRSILENSTTAKTRYKSDVFVLEGWRCIAEALNIGLVPQAILFSRSKLLLKINNILGYDESKFQNFLNELPLYVMPYRDFKTWSHLTTPPGIMGAFHLSKAIEFSSRINNSDLPLTVILDEIRDPSNMGSILRTLAAAGVDRVLLMKGCCDMWDLKVLRCASGANFHMNIDSGVTWPYIKEFIDPKADVYLAEACLDMRNDEEVEFEPLMKKNRNFEKDCESSKYNLEQANIPISSDQAFEKYPNNFDQNESSYENLDLNKENVDQTEDNSRYLDQKKIYQENLDQLDNFEETYEVDESGKVITYDSSYDDINHVKLFRTINLPTTSYDKINYFTDFNKENYKFFLNNRKIENDTDLNLNNIKNSSKLKENVNFSENSHFNKSSQNTKLNFDNMILEKELEKGKKVLILGGETGLSDWAKKFAVEFYGDQIYVPMRNKIDSLNSAVAAGIIVYEIKRQFNRVK